MGRKKKLLPESDPVQNLPNSPEPEASKVETKNEAKVTCPNPADNRTYSLEAHGEDYKNLANQYAKKKGGQVE